MNVTNITIVRDTIAALDPSRFDMMNWVSGGQPLEVKHNCNTAACIGGWAATLLIDPQSEDRYEEYNATFVGGLLGLEQQQSYDLFFPLSGTQYRDLPLSYSEFTQAKAVAVLDNLLATGEVDWVKVMGE